MRFNDVTNWLSTCRLEVIRPASCWSCRAAVTASSWSIVCTQCLGPGSTIMPTREPQRIPETEDGGVVNHKPHPDQQLLHYRKMSYGTGNPAGPRRSVGDPQCQMEHRIHRKAPPGTSLMEEKQQGTTVPVAMGQLRQGAAPGLCPVRVGSHPAEGATGPAAATSPGPYPTG